VPSYPSPRPFYIFFKLIWGKAKNCSSKHSSSTLEHKNHSFKRSLDTQKFTSYSHFILGSKILLFVFAISFNALLFVSFFLESWFYSIFISKPFAAAIFLHLGRAISYSLCLSLICKLIIDASLAVVKRLFLSFFLLGTPVSPFLPLFPLLLKTVRESLEVEEERKGSRLRSPTSESFVEKWFFIRNYYYITFYLHFLFLHRYHAHPIFPIILNHSFTFKIKKWGMEGWPYSLYHLVFFRFLISFHFFSFLHLIRHFYSFPQRPTASLKPFFPLFQILRFLSSFK